MNNHIVFTDGSCSNNGKVNAKAGIGVYFGQNDPRNISKRVIGKQTNNTAELSAVIEVFTILEDEIKSNDTIIIYTDSEYVIKCCCSYGLKSEKNNWKNKKGYIPNYELVKQIYELFKFNPNVSIKHIKAHTGLSDELSLGNEGADKLANISVGLTECPSIKRDKIYLNVQYSEKEVAKKYGAKWDKNKKKWYYTTQLSEDNQNKLKSKFDTI